jgi:hypothetical protein
LKVKLLHPLQETFVFPEPKRRTGQKTAMKQAKMSGKAILDTTSISSEVVLDFLPPFFP